MNSANATEECRPRWSVGALRSVGPVSDTVDFDAEVVGSPRHIDFPPAPDVDAVSSGGPDQVAQFTVEVFGGFDGQVIPR